MSLAADDSNNTDMEDYKFLCQPCILVSHPVCVCVSACAVSRLHAFIQSASLQTSMNYTLHIIGVVPSFRFKHTVARRTSVNSTHPHPVIQLFCQLSILVHVTPFKQLLSEWSPGVHPEYSLLRICG